MPERVCPWWLGYVLASPIRRLTCNPARLLAPYVRAGMTVLEPGPGMGFFTLELARRVGDSGRVIAVDVQPRMIEGLKRRAAKAGLLSRIEPRLAQTGSLGVHDLAGAVNFTLAYAMVHELPDEHPFFSEIAETMKGGAHLLLVEPGGHVSEARFESELMGANRAGLKVAERLHLGHSRAALLRKP